MPRKSSTASTTQAPSNRPSLKALLEQSAQLYAELDAAFDTPSEANVDAIDPQDGANQTIEQLNNVLGNISDKIDAIVHILKFDLPTKIDAAKRLEQEAKDYRVALEKKAEGLTQYLKYLYDSGLLENQLDSSSKLHGKVHSVKFAKYHKPSIIVDEELMTEAWTQEQLDELTTVQTVRKPDKKAIAAYLEKVEAEIKAAQARVDAGEEYTDTPRIIAKAQWPLGVTAQYATTIKFNLAELE